jgi:capsular polysaccharide biosynthesis protein
MVESEKNEKKKHEASNGSVEAAPEIEEITSIDQISPFHTEQIPVIKEKTAKNIAIVLVVGYLFLMTLSFVYLLAFKGTVVETVELMKTISAVLLGTIGSVLGYYFGKTAGRENE